MARSGRVGHGPVRAPKCESPLEMQKIEFVYAKTAKLLLCKPVFARYHGFVRFHRNLFSIVAQIFGEINETFLEKRSKTRHDNSI